MCVQASPAPEDYSQVIESMPKLGGEVSWLPDFAQITVGSIEYGTGHFDGEYNGIEIHGDFDRGILQRLSIVTKGGKSDVDGAIIADFLAATYGRPTFKSPGAYYEWKFSANGRLWTIAS